MKMNDKALNASHCELWLLAPNVDNADARSHAANDSE